MQRSDIDGMVLEESVSSSATLGTSLKSCHMGGVRSSTLLDSHRYA